MDIPDYDRVVGNGLSARGEDKAYRPLSFINPVSLFGIAIPQREWLVQDWLPIGYGTSNSGDGGTGKTLLAQQLATSCATGRPWLGLAVRPCKVLALLCEDDEDELHRRQDAINGHLGLSFADLDNLRWATGVGQDNALAEFDFDGRMTLTKRFSDVEKQALEFGAELVVLDTAADLFGGNENDRRQVRRFVAEAVNGLARKIRGAVLLNTHPSRAGMAAGGSGDSGSTAWANTVRSRWTLTRPEPDDTGSVDPHERILTRRKANYASIGDEIRLRWANGVLVPHGSDYNRFTAASRRDECEQVFLALLAQAEAQQRPLSQSANSGNYAPAVFAKSPDRQGFSRRDFEVAMEALFASGNLQIVRYGPPSRGTTKLATLPRKAAPEATDA